MRPLITSILCLLSLPIFAQTAPPPPTPYPFPITGYAGRYVDSSSTFDRFTYPTTFRAYRVKFAPERDRVYMIMSFTTFAGQRLSTFPGRLASEALQTVPGAPPFFGEKYLALDESFDALRPGSGWSPLNSGEVARRLFDFDWDDRGLTYLAYGVYGWGILDQNLQVVSTSAPSFEPAAILSFRNGSTYYAFVSGPSLGSSILYDVTNPQPPSAVALRPSFFDYAKGFDGHIAIAYGNTLRIYTAAGLVADTALATFTHTASHLYIDVTTDGVNFYALERSDFSTTDTIHIIKPSGATYADVAQVQVPYGSATIGYGAGYVAVTRPYGATRTIGLYQVGGAGLTLLNDTYLAIYTGARKTAEDAQIIMSNGTPYLVIAAGGLGDVFTLAAPTPLLVAKQFAPSTIPAGTNSQLTVTITNPNPTPVTSFSFTDTYPANLVNATPAGAATTCGGTLSAGTSSFTLTNASLAASANCSVTVNVTANVPGPYTNTIAAGAIASSDNTNAAGSATLLVSALTAPVVAKAFSPSTGPLGAPVRLVITLTNPNGSAITGVTLTDDYPANLVNATPANASTTCGGSVTAPNGGTLLALSGGTIPASSSCSVSVDVIAQGSGPIANSVSGVTSTNAAPSTGVAAATFNATIPGAPTLSQWSAVVLAALLALAALRHRV